MYKSIFSKVSSSPNLLQYFTLKSIHLSKNSRNWNAPIASLHSSVRHSNQQQPEQEPVVEQQQKQVNETKPSRPTKQYNAPIARGIQKIGQITAYFSKNFYALFVALGVVVATYIYNNAFFPAQEDTNEEKQVMSERALLDEIELKARGEKI